jgi:UDP-N-acetylmuramate dehydrogenase
MSLFHNHSLKEYNTFNINVNALYSFFVYNEESLLLFFETPIFKENKRIVIGGGSNILFKKNYNGVVILIRNKGIQTVKEDSDFIYIKAQAGEIWDDFVEFCVNRDLGGLENLSLIPGTVGASPVQNIGAYGVELKDVFYEAEYIDIQSGQKHKIRKEECKFAYRDSIFKNELSGKAILMNVTFKLSKKPKPALDYGTINEELKYIKTSGIKDVRNAVIKIRRSKLPDPKELPNAGSFFKNPVVEKEKYNNLLESFPGLVAYPIDNKHVKLAAGQLIDICGWKGKRFENVGVHEKQALVLVNYNDAKSSDIIQLADMIQESVYNTFVVRIEKEVIIIE